MVCYRILRNREMKGWGVTRWGQSTKRFFEINTNVSWYQIRGIVWSWGGGGLSQMAMERTLKSEIPHLFKKGLLKKSKTFLLVYYLIEFFLYLFTSEITLQNIVFASITPISNTATVPILKIDSVSHNIYLALGHIYKLFCSYIWHWRHPNTWKV